MSLVLDDVSTHAGNAPVSAGVSLDNHVAPHFLDVYGARAVTQTYTAFNAADLNVTAAVFDGEVAADSASRDFP